jgi:DNA-binding IclR family transcriptional regulator
MRSLLTNHGLVLLRIAVGPHPATLAQIAADVQIQTQAAYGIVRDLVDEGLIVKAKSGRRNDYEIHWDRVGTYSLLDELTVARTLALLSAKSLRSGAARERSVGPRGVRRGLEIFAHLMRTAPRTKVLLALLRRPHAVAGEVATAAGMEPAKTLHTLEGLERDGLVQRDGADGEPRFIANLSVFPEMEHGYSSSDVVAVVLDHLGKEGRDGGGRKRPARRPRRLLAGAADGRHDTD